MSGKNSRERRKEAVSAANQIAYGGDVDISHFDERQTTIFNKELSKAITRKSRMDILSNEMWIAYTGMSEEEYYSTRGLKDDY